MLIQTSYLLSLCNIAQNYPIEFGTSYRAERAKAKLERKSLLKLAHSKGRFPLYSKGKMVVEHPNYGELWATDVPLES